MLFAFICLVAAVIELRPLKKIPPGYGWPKPRSNVLALTMDFTLSPAMRYSSGDNCLSFSSLPYTAVVKLAYYLIPSRLICLRVVSLVSTLVALLFIYLTAALLFNPQIGLISVFILATTPVYLDKMLSYGYIPFSTMVVSVIGYILASCLKNKSYIKTILLSVMTYVTLSLYASARLVSLWIALLYGIYWKQFWKHLLAYFLIIIALVTVSDRLFRGDGYDFFRRNSFFDTERNPFSGAGTDPGKIIGGIIERINANVITASYYFSFRQEPYFNPADEEWTKPPGIINIVYFPFMIVGVAICLVKPRKSHAYLLTCSLVFFLIVFIGSDRLLERRVINAISAAALLISLGLWNVYSYVQSKITAGKLANCVKLALGALLIIPGGYNIRYYLSSFSKTGYDYSHLQLSSFADAVREYGSEVRAIRYNRASEVLIWGNPHFDYDLISREIIQKLQVDNWDHNLDLIRPVNILGQIDFAQEEGGNVLYIHTYLPPLPGYNSGDEFWPASDIAKARQSMSGLADIFQVPSIEEVYFMLVK